jgi:hypothetical protein
MQARDFFDEQPAAPPRQPAPEPHEAREQSAEPATPIAPAAPAPAPIAPAVVFHAVSEHDTGVEEAHRPVRRRHKDHAPEADGPPSLQMVVTQGDTASLAVAQEEDEPQRRTRPRKRRGGPAPAEPLMMVETQQGADGARPDSQP